MALTGATTGGDASLLVPSGSGYLWNVIQDLLTFRGSLALPMTMAQLANTVQYETLLGFVGSLQTLEVIVDVPVTTGAKAATLTASVTNVGTTGGVMATTSANMTPRGKRNVATAITAANTFVATDTLGYIPSSVTTYIEGTATAYLGYVMR